MSIFKRQLISVSGVLLHGFLCPTAFCFKKHLKSMRFVYVCLVICVALFGDCLQQYSAWFGHKAWRVKQGLRSGWCLLCSSAHVLKCLCFTATCFVRTMNEWMFERHSTLPIASATIRCMYLVSSWAFVQFCSCMFVRVCPLWLTLTNYGVSRSYAASRIQSER